MTDFLAHIAAEEAHTAKLAAQPGWREYIEHKAARMAKWMPQIVAQTPIAADDDSRETAEVT